MQIFVLALYAAVYPALLAAVAILLASPRRSRLLTAFLSAGLTVSVGAGLGMSGAALQGTMRNPLAEQYLLGVSGGAAVGAVVVTPGAVVVVAPGFVETRMTQATAERLGVDFEAFKIGAASQIPLRRVGQPEDIASVIAFLCSDESGFVSGQTIYVRGGP